MGIDGIIDARSQRELNAARNKGVGDGPGVRHRARQPVELWHDKRVAGADSSKRLVEARPGPVCAGQPVIGVDPVSGDAELSKRGLLGSEVLLVGRAAGVADQGHCHSLNV